DDVLDGRRAERLPERRRVDRERQRTRNGGEFRTQLVGDLALLLRSLFPGLQAQDGDTVGDGGKARDRRPGGGLGQLRVELLDRLDLLGGVLRRRTLRGGHDAEDDAPVLQRRQL